MTQNTLLAIWEKRRVALEQHLTMLRNDSALRDENFARKLALSKLIDSLIPFGNSHFGFFSRLFEDDGLNASSIFPRQFVMRQVITRIAEDAEVLQNCLDQRRHWQSLDERHAQEVLLKADKLAWAALRFAADRNLVPKETTAITYFQKSTSIRVVPYASVALIGIPITCLVNDIDYLSIPHEVGHYIYWNSGLFLEDQSPSIQSRLTEAMKGAPYWIQRWKQEVFADTFGVLVAQAAIACSFQDLEFEGSKTDLMVDDKKHPAPIVRPEIYNAAIGKDNEKLAGDLADRWDGLVGERHSILRLDRQDKWAYLKVHKDPESTDILLPNEIEQNYQKLLDEISIILSEHKPEVEPVFPGRGETDLDKVYSTFSAELQQLNDPVDLEDKDRNISTKAWEEWVKPFETTAKNIPVDDWITVLRAGGWSTEGPVGRDIID